MNARDLDEAVARGCQVPGCREHGHALFLRSRCHPMARGVAASYLGGVLRLECVACGKAIVNVDVARDRPRGEDGG